MSNIINMGIPVYSSLVLPIYDMTLLCSDNKVKSNHKKEKTISRKPELDHI